MEINKKIIIKIIFIALSVYVLFGLFIFFNQTNFFYYPDNTDFKSCAGFDNYEKMNFNGTRFYFLEQTNDVIVFYHGNAGSACDRNFLRKIFDKTNKSIIFVEYAGYSSDPQAPTKKLFFKDAKNINSFISENKFKNITVVGESIGTGVASYHAKIANIDNLLLISPFTKILEVAKSKYPIYPISLMLKENYDNIENLKNYKERLLIIHGVGDKIFSVEYAKILYNKIPASDKEYFFVENAGHNDLYGFEEVGEQIFEFVK